MTGRDRLLLLILLVDSVVLALVELLFLPIRLDGHLLPAVGAIPVPFTALVAGVTMPWLVSLAARISASTSVAAAPLLVWLLTLGVFGLAGPGGDRVLTIDWRSLLLFACGAIPAAVVIGRVHDAELEEIRSAARPRVGETAKGGKRD